VRVPAAEFHEVIVAIRPRRLPNGRRQAPGQISVTKLVDELHCGTIIAESLAPRFAAPGQDLLVSGEVGAFYRSNGNAWGGNLSGVLANENLSANFSATTAKADNYTAGGDFKNFTATGNPGHTLARDEVGSTAYETHNYQFGLAYRQRDHRLEFKYAYQDMPEQLFPNQRMDMLGNTANRFNLRYLGQYDWGQLEARAYYETVDHLMDFGPDKRFYYGMASGGHNAVNGMPCSPISATCAAGMPMKTDSNTSGVTVRADVNLGVNDLLRVGGLYQHYRLDDYWPASGGGMWPLTFDNINDGTRDRLGVFGEWESRLDAQWTTLLGVRYEHVTTDAGPVQGYNPNINSTGMPPNVMWNNQKADAAAFNAQNRKQNDNNWDLTALARYALDTQTDLEVGVARKTRSPNLYERYTWSTWSMAAAMNNFAGDGNGYYGDIDLDPEVAYTISASVDWHATDRSWQLRATPYYTRVKDYIDAIRCNNTTTCPPPNATTTNQFVILQYANQSAELYGIDVSGELPLARSDIGNFGLNGVLSYTYGKNRDTGDGLYNIMPFNARLTLSHRYGGVGQRGRVRRRDIEGSPVRRAQRNRHTRLRTAEPARQLFVEAGSPRRRHRQRVRQALLPAARGCLHGSGNNDDAEHDSLGYRGSRHGPLGLYRGKLQAVGGAGNSRWVGAQALGEDGVDKRVIR
jgi:iron complex outermembrane receptor protein